MYPLAVRLHLRLSSCRLWTYGLTYPVEGQVGGCEGQGGVEVLEAVGIAADRHIHEHQQGNDAVQVQDDRRDRALPCQVQQGLEPRRK